MKLSVIVVLILATIGVGAVIGYFIFQHVNSTFQSTTITQNATQGTFIPQNATENTTTPQSVTKGTTIPPLTETELE